MLFSHFFVAAVAMVAVIVVAYGEHYGHDNVGVRHRHHPRLSADLCAGYPSCNLCVKKPYCGWCSNPVTYQNGQVGEHCVNQSTQFECTGIYSTDTCQAGYVCNLTSFQCVLGQPGAGEPLATCQLNCSSVGKTFTCNNHTGQCEVAQPGQGTSLQQCQASCHGPTHSTASDNTHSANTHSANTHSANTQTKHQESTTIAPPTSTAVPLYTCDVNTVQCVPATAGKGEALIVCQQTCTNHSHITPSNLIGTWRGIAVGNGYATGAAIPEFDFLFGAKDSDFKLYANAAQITPASVTYVGASAFRLTSSSSFLPNEVACIFDSSAPLPTTLSLMVACVEGSTFPASIAAAFAASKSNLWLLQSCATPQYCSFNLPPPPVPPKVKRAVAQAVAAANKHHARKVVDIEPVFAAAVDSCSQYKTSCTACLAHTLCGWCSQNVVYKNGEAGTQCAGFNANGQQNDFTCTGTYVTDKCVPGWQCNASSQQCVPTQPGEGIPSKKACEASCKAQPGPPSQLLGDWRGIQVSKGYPTGTFKLHITQSNWTMITPSASNPAGTTTQFSVRTLGSEIILEALVNPYTLQGIYANGANAEIQYETLAFGAKNEAVPASFNGAMEGGTVWVMAKCGSSECTW